MKHLYIHIPFCHRRCAYCDFNTYANMDDRIEAYVVALCAELRLLAETVVPAPPTSADAASLPPTIFLGGGTPTMLSLDQMGRVLDAASAIVPLEGAEVSSEANPGTVLGRDYLRGLRQLGVNRLSMGVQSLHDPTLRMLGRIHTADEATRSYVEAREAGFDNINLDFIFGMPGQSHAQWEATLDEIVTWEVDHFSLYSLILEEQTPLFAQVTAGRVSLPDDDATAAMYEAAMDRFAAAGYVQYEISNFARGDVLRESTALPEIPSRACAHNLAYWLNSDYIAAGAGAYGHITAGGSPHRYYDILAVEGYIAAAGSGGRPLAETIPLSAADIRAETMMMGLRLNVGVSEDHFAGRCGARLEEVYGEQIAELVTQGLIERADGRVRLTLRGRMLGNQVFLRFL
ncbi:radical SAM family heme chaperone HemW [Chloroflexales bacterium ZM16-3]|nr:radical SAM family heme chaperone HemW [Chloroflexales bacterium ZM16-3]